VVINPSSTPSINSTLLGLAVNGSEKFRIDASGNVFTAGLTTQSGGFISNASSSIASTLSVTGATTISSTLSIQSLTTLTGGFITQSSSTVNAPLTVAGPLNVSSTLLIGSVLNCSASNQALQTDTTGRVTCGTLATGGGSFNGQLANANLFVTDGTTTSTLRSDFLAISTSTANRLGLFNVDSNGSVYSSGTLQISGLSRLMGGFVSGVSSSVSGVLSVSGNLNASSSLFIGGIIICTGTSALQVDANGKVQCGVISGLSGSFNGQLANANLFVTDGTTTSTLRSDFLAISTSTANRLGLFNIDSTGSLSSSGTAQFFGLTTLNSGFISSASSTVNGPLTVAGPLNVSSTLLISGLFAMPSGFISSASSTVNGPLTVAGPLNASSTFLARSLSVFVGGFTSSASSTVSSTLSLTGTTTISDILNVRGKIVRPIVVGTIPVGNLVNSVAVVGHYVYIASSTALGVYDVSVPTRPTFVARDTSVIGDALQIVGKYAYILDMANNRFSIIDISNPVSSTRLSSFSTPSFSTSNPRTFFVSGRYAYISGAGASSNVILVIFGVGVFVGVLVILVHIPV
jgi:hypothetical protein